MQVTIARQLGLDPSTVSNFFMNARRRSVDKWKDERALLGKSTHANAAADSDDDENEDDDFEEEEEEEEEAADSPQPMTTRQSSRTVFITDGEQQQIMQQQQQPQQQQQQLILVKTSSGQFISASSVGSPAAVVQHVGSLGGCGGDLTPTSLGSAASLDL